LNKMSEVYIPQVGGQENNSTHFRHQEKAAHTNTG
jgi:hypothetical protein